VGKVQSAVPAHAAAVRAAPVETASAIPASLMPLWWGAAGIGGVVVVSRFWSLSLAGWIAAIAYLVVSTALVCVGLARRHAPRFGWANATTATRSTLVGLITGVVVSSFTMPIAVPLLVGLTIPALALDAVDGWLARRTHGESELGARYDMEVDAYLLLVLSVAVAQSLGAWVLAIGLMRYAFVAAGLVLPWMRATLPPRPWRKVVTAANGIALVAAASELLPTAVSAAIVLVALALLVESFGRDVVWLAVRARSARRSARRLARRSAHRSARTMEG
jgi:phosphatidylglycerophosphate synthase